jgi:Ca-activated chloride channel family protein
MFRQQQRIVRACLLILSVIVLLSERPALAQGEQAFPINLSFIVVDKNNHLVTTLRKEDIQIIEDGIPQQIITFQPNNSRPLALAVLIDTSVSQERLLPGVKKAAGAFIDSIMRPGQDSVAIISFTDRPELVSDLTSDPAQVRSALDQVKFVPPEGYVGGGQIASPSSAGINSLAGSTAIWDALWVTSEKLLKPSAANARRAILLFTDGTDSSSRKRIGEAIDSALQAEAIIYAIGVRDEYYGEVSGGNLRKVTEKTGGRSFIMRKESDLPAIFASIKSDIRSQYLVTYRAGGGKSNRSLHDIKIELVNPELRKQGLRLFHR